MIFEILAAILALFIFILYLIGGVKFFKEAEDLPEGNAFMLAFIFALFMGVFTFYLSHEIISKLAPLAVGIIVAVVVTFMIGIPTLFMGRKYD